jgi:hypothetical protein
MGFDFSNQSEMVIVGNCECCFKWKLLDTLLRLLLG